MAFCRVFEHFAQIDLCIFTNRHCGIDKHAVFWYHSYSLLQTEELMENNAPWLADYGNVPFHLEYPHGSMCDCVFKTASDAPEATALYYMGKRTSYKALADKIRQCARAFAALGVKKGDRVVVCLPNTPQAVYCLYALNMLGAITCMIHPLSAEQEIAAMVAEVNSAYAVTLDQFADKFCAAKGIKRLIVTSAADELGHIKSTAFKATTGRKYKSRIPAGALHWRRFIAGGKGLSPESYGKAEDTAVVLFSGGTTGVTKGIRLSNLNFNALAMQTAAMCGRPTRGRSMLAAMPMFHGFGLGVCIHTMLVAGGSAILVPKFNSKEYALLVKKNRPNYIAGVPTLFEALTRMESLDGVKLDFLMGVFSGGDSLSVELKKKMDAFLADHGASVKIREGYGTTECVTASCLTPYHTEREGSIGYPYPDTYYKICAVNTTEELPYGTEGEICIKGPSVMQGYIGHEEENAKALQTHADGCVWLHTGDLGVMDSDGFIYFRQRIKRMIITSGYNVYPSRLENIIDAHPAVQMSCVIGVKDPYKMQKVKAFVVLKKGITASDTLKADIFEHCRKRIAKYAMPYEIEFRSELPKTGVGKIAYTVLEDEENNKVN